MLAETHVFFLCLIRSRNSKDRQYNGQKKKDKWTMIYITLHRNIKIEQHEPHSKPDVNSGPPRKVKQFPLHMWQPSCYFLLQTRWYVMNVKNSSNVIKTTLQPSHYNLISWRLVNLGLKCRLWIGPGVNQFFWAKERCLGLQCAVCTMGYSY